MIGFVVVKFSSEVFLFDDFFTSCSVLAALAVVARRFLPAARTLLWLFEREPLVTSVGIPVFRHQRFEQEVMIDQILPAIFLNDFLRFLPKIGDTIL